MVGQSSKAKDLVAPIAGFVVSGVFLYCGAAKIRDPAGFAWAIHSYQLLPYYAAATLAIYLPWLELLCGLGLLWPPTSRGALIVLLGLCLVYSSAVVLALLRGLDISCGCFGGDGIGCLPLVVSLACSGFLAFACWWLFRHEDQSLDQR